MKQVKLRSMLLAALVAVLAAAGIGLMAGGWLTMGEEKQEQYDRLLQQASTLYVSDYEQAAQLLTQAEELFPDKIEAGRQEAYALYLNGRWQDCVDRCAEELERHGSDAQTRLIMASAPFELGAIRRQPAGLRGVSGSYGPDRPRRERAAAAFRTGRRPGRDPVRAG